MATISVSLPSDGTTADVADVNTPITTIVNEINGNLNNDNISSLNGSKITAGTLPPSAMDTNFSAGWQALSDAPDTTTYNGNHNYDLVFNSTDHTDVIGLGDRLLLPRTVTAPTQCTSLNGTTQYFSKTSPAGMTFTDDFAATAHIPAMTAYPASEAGIVSRYNGTSGWTLSILSTGQIQLVGYNGGAANYSRVISYQSVPLNKKVHIAAQLDMSAFTATDTTSYIMINGRDVPAYVDRGGTNPTALVQAGDLQVGAKNSINFFSGKLAQVAVFSAKVTQATMRGYYSQGFSGSETSLISAYSFNNSINDLNTTNANNLTANGSATATNADSPFAGGSGGVNEYGIVMAKSFSTNTTLNVQVPEGYAIPTSGGVNNISYSHVKCPYGFPSQRGKWRVEAMQFWNSVQATPTTGTYYNIGSMQLNAPIGEWVGSYQVVCYGEYNAGAVDVHVTLSTSASAVSDPRMTCKMFSNGGPSVIHSFSRQRDYSLAAATTYYLIAAEIRGALNNLFYYGDTGYTVISFECAYL